MEKLHVSVDISAPKEKVWKTMLEEETYRKWTEVFASGSHYEGSWDKGSKILFLAPDDEGKLGGMVSRIKENREYEYISIEHLGLIHDGVEDHESGEVQKWAPALENYTFTEKKGNTTVAVDMDIDKEHEEMFRELWPKALQKLKKLAEN